MSEFWAYCEPCSRWFYPESSSEAARPAPTCPVCSTEAVTVSEEPGQPA